MAQKKQFKDLDLSNAFLFAAASEDEETCRLVLECILGTPVGKVKVKVERNILLSSDFRCVRLDVFASSECPLGDGTRRIFLSTKSTNEALCRKSFSVFYGTSRIPRTLM